MWQKVKFKIIIAAVAAIFLLCFYYKSASNTLRKKAEYDFESVLTQSVYSAIESNVEYSQMSKIVKIERNSNGDIAFVSTDSFLTSVISYKLAGATLRNLDEYCKNGVKIPLGAFTGISFLSGAGKSVSVKMITISSVRCDFDARFESVGINQTRQSLYINVVADISFVMPFSDGKKSSAISILVYDNVIVGKVPEIYLTK